MRRGLVGGLLGVVAVGAAAGLTAERYAVGRARLAPDPEEREPFFDLPADRVKQVPANDGVLLHVEELGPSDAELTIVFCHGYTQQLAVWHYQRQALSQDRASRKLVLWDQRSHGRSERSSAEHSTIDQLGNDLQTILADCAPTGRIVLVGHSMGGMTIMALADQRPELFGSRVVGVALLSTSTGKLALTLGLPAALGPVTGAVLPWLTRGMKARPRVFERGRRMGGDLAFVATRRGAFGSSDVSPALVEFVEQMTEQTPVDVIAEFYATFRSHDKLKALEVLDQVETLVLVGSKDVVTPVKHSRVIAEFLPHAHLVVVEGAGHMVQLERAPLVTLQLQALLRRATRAHSRTA